jgi:hypothetical protein
MKKSLYLFFILTSLFCSAQSGPNPFAEKESNNTFSKGTAARETQSQPAPQNQQGESNLDSGGGNPADPLPIDNYIPLLIITAVGIIVYQTNKQKKIITKDSAQ